MRRKEMHSILVTDGNFTYVSIDDQGASASRQAGWAADFGVKARHGRARPGHPRLLSNRKKSKT
jgi:hypothetical protein